MLPESALNINIYIYIYIYTSIIKCSFPLSLGMESSYVLSHIV